MNVINTIINSAESSISLNEFGIIPNEETKINYNSISETSKNDWGKDIYNHKILQYLIIKSLHNKEYIGTSYGGWFIPRNILDKNSVCYSAGFTKDGSFELELNIEYNCKTYIFDPLPNAYNDYQKFISFIEKRENINEGVDNYDFWNNILTECKFLYSECIMTEKLNFIKYGIYDSDTNITLHKSDESLTYVEVKEMYSIMHLLKHNKVDLLKLSVGDNACRILHNILTNGIYPKILCIEFCEFTKLDNTSIQMDAEDYFEKLKTFCKIIDMLSFNGYKLLDDSRKGKMTFVSKFC